LSAITVAELKGVYDHFIAVVDLNERKGFRYGWTFSKTFDDRILPMDTVVARIAGAIEDDAKGKGQSPGLGDIIIAATAKAYDLTVITEIYGTSNR
jgi:predicted nucleic acid-binding protein